MVRAHIQIKINNMKYAARCADIAQQTENKNAAFSKRLASVATFRTLQSLENILLEYR